MEEGVRLLDDGRAVEGLLHPVAGDGEHGYPAVLDLGELRLLAAELERVEAQVARHVVRVREALNVVQRGRLEVGRAEGGEEQEGALRPVEQVVEQRRRAACGLLEDVG